MKLLSLTILILSLIVNVSAQSKKDNNFSQIVDSIELKTKKIMKQLNIPSEVIPAPISQSEIGLIVGTQAIDTTADLKSYYELMSEKIKTQIENEAITDNTQYVAFISISYNYPNSKWKESIIFNYKREGKKYKLKR